MGILKFFDFQNVMNITNERAIFITHVQVISFLVHNWGLQPHGLGSNFAMNNAMALHCIRFFGLQNFLFD
jgi:hypothetical protein